jgi:uncharacterized DUF497 family protein
MMNRDFAALRWDDWNRQHLEKHGITPAQAERVVQGTSYLQESYKGRLLVVGPEDSGRVLAVAIGLVPGTENVWYVFSARPASRKERSRYTEWKGDQSE